MLDYGGRGAVNIGIDSTLSNIHDENVDGGNLDASYQHKNSSSFSRRTDSLNTSGISGTRHIGVGCKLRRRGPTITGCTSTAYGASIVTETLCSRS